MRRVTSVAGYMLIVEPAIATIAIAFFVPSLLVVPLIQKKVNELAEERTTRTRALGENILEENDAGRDESDRLIETI